MSPPSPSSSSGTTTPTSPAPSTTTPFTSPPTPGSSLKAKRVRPKAKPAVGPDSPRTSPLKVRAKSSPSPSPSSKGSRSREREGERSPISPYRPSIDLGELSGESSDTGEETLRAFPHAQQQRGRPREPYAFPASASASTAAADWGSETSTLGSGTPRTSVGEWRSDSSTLRTSLDSASPTSPMGTIRAGQRSTTTSSTTATTKRMYRYSTGGTILPNSRYLPPGMAAQQGSGSRGTGAPRPSVIKMDRSTSSPAYQAATGPASAPGGRSRFSSVPFWKPSPPPSASASPPGTSSFLFPAANPSVSSRTLPRQSQRPRHTRRSSSSSTSRAPRPRPRSKQRPRPVSTLGFGLAGALGSVLGDLSPTDGVAKLRDGIKQVLGDERSEALGFGRDEPVRAEETETDSEVEGVFGRTAYAAKTKARPRHWSTPVPRPLHGAYSSARSAQEQSEKVLPDWARSRNRLSSVYGIPPRAAESPTSSRPSSSGWSTPYSRSRVSSTTARPSRAGSRASYATAHSFQSPRSQSTMLSPLSTSVAVARSSVISCATIATVLFIACITIAAVLAGIAGSYILTAFDDLSRFVPSLSTPRRTGRRLIEGLGEGVTTIGRSVFGRPDLQSRQSDASTATHSADDQKDTTEPATRTWAGSSSSSKQSARPQSANSSSSTATSSGDASGDLPRPPLALLIPSIFLALGITIFKLLRDWSAAPSSFSAEQRARSR